MKFLMLVCHDDSIAFAPQDSGNIASQVQEWVSEMEQRWVRLQGDVLAPVEATATVGVRGDEGRVDRGPRVDLSAPASGFKSR
jgi:hypothetical protein